MSKPTYTIDELVSMLTTYKESNDLLMDGLVENYKILTGKYEQALLKVNKLETNLTALVGFPQLDKRITDIEGSLGWIKASIGNRRKE